MSATNQPPIEPAALEFFASAAGVCVYVNVRGRAFRVQFESPDGPATVQRTTEHGADEAVAAASLALDKHKAELTPLFERVELERAARKD